LVLLGVSFPAIVWGKRKVGNQIEMAGNDVVPGHAHATRWVERLDEAAPTVPVKLEVQIGEELEAHTMAGQGR
jgi:hypothetical protein